jgi:hypothetical protein
MLGRIPCFERDASFADFALSQERKGQALQTLAVLAQTAAESAPPAPSLFQRAFSAPHRCCALLAWLLHVRDDERRRQVGRCCLKWLNAIRCIPSHHVNRVPCTQFAVGARRGEGQRRSEQIVYTEQLVRV